MSYYRADVDDLEKAHKEILETLSDCINMADEKGIYEAGDKIFDIIIALKTEWGMDLD